MSSSSKKTKTSSSSSSKGKRARPLSTRDQATREFEHANTLVRRYTEQFMKSSDADERKALQSLIDIHKAHAASAKSRMEVASASMTVKKKEDARSAAIRRMGQALPSKMLDSNPDLLAPLRDAVLKAFTNDNDRQIFLAGVGKAQQDLNRPKRRTTKRAEEENDGEEEEGDSSESSGEEEGNQSQGGSDGATSGTNNGESNSNAK